MKAFMDKEFMLQSPTAQHLYHAYAEGMPCLLYTSVSALDGTAAHGYNGGS